MTHNLEANAANEFLMQTVVPDFAKYIDASSSALAFEKLVLKLKMNGLNLELLGAVRHAAETPEAKSLLLHEIVRCCMLIRVCCR
jgi:hypothetical protein